MNALLTSDLHFTDHPRDSYRWKLFEWLAETIPKHDVKYLFLLGDLTEAKDRHSGRLVNQVVESLVRLFRRTTLLRIIILRGNHDGIDPNQSYFKFLSKFPSIEFIETPFFDTFSDREILFLPHTTDPGQAWKNVDMRKADYIFMHATVQDAHSESGFQLKGMPMSFLSTAKKAKIYSGDIHVPQTIGSRFRSDVGSRRVEVEYVGAPYPVRFGDTFLPRAILLENFRKAQSLPINIIQRLMLTVTAGDREVNLAGANKGDQVKVRVRLSPAEYGDWPELKRKVVAACNEAGVELCGLELERTQEKAPTTKARPAVGASVRTPQQVLQDYCIANKIPKSTTKEGESLLEQASQMLQ